MSPGRLVAGFALIGVGILTLLDVQGSLDAGSIIGRWWPVVLIALGVARLAGDPQSRVGSLILIGLGALLLIDSLELVDAWSYVWPLALIAIGAAILFQRAGTQSTDPASDTVSAAAILSGRTVRPTSDAFAGGEVTAILGSLELDLSGSTPAPGASLSATVVLGGLDVIVPAGWIVKLSGTPILGGWDDTTQRNAAGPDAPVLSIRALVVLGGVEVRHAERWG